MTTVRVSMLFMPGKTGEVYNIGAGNEKTNIEIAKTVLNLLNKSEDLITFVQDRPAHDFRYSIATEKIRGLEWTPVHTFEEGMKKTIDWYLANPCWWRPLLQLRPVCQNSTMVLFIKIFHFNTLNLPRISNT